MGGAGSRGGRRATEQHCKRMQFVCSDRKVGRFERYVHLDGRFDVRAFARVFACDASSRVGPDLMPLQFRCLRPFAGGFCGCVVAFWVVGRSRRQLAGAAGGGSVGTAGVRGVRYCECPKELKASSKAVAAQKAEVDNMLQHEVWGEAIEFGDALAERAGQDVSFGSGKCTSCVAAHQTCLADRPCSVSSWRRRQRVDSSGMRVDASRDGGVRGLKRRNDRFDGGTCGLKRDDGSDEKMFTSVGMISDSGERRLPLGQVARRVEVAGCRE